MKQAKFYLFILLVGLLAILFPISVLADAAPPDVPGGENINPGEGSTMVQMVAEEVIIDVGLSQEEFYASDGWSYTAGYIVSYNCTFWLQNQGTETEDLAVRFPINTFYEYGKINILSIKVNEQPIPWIEDEVDYTTSNLFYWAHFDVVFPPGEEVELKVTYTTISEAWIGSLHHRVSYILETGAGWYGPIEQGRIILRLPYQVTSENVIEINFQPVEGIYNDSDLYWDFTDLEPSPDDNWEVLIVSPDLWLGILTERNRLEASPNNVSALFRLAENISQATIAYWGEIYSTTLYEEGLEAINLAISLNPDDENTNELYTRYLEAFTISPTSTANPTENYWALQTATARAMATATFTPTLIPTSTQSISPATRIIPTSTPNRVTEQETLPLYTGPQTNSPKVDEENLTSDADQPLNLFLIISIVILLLLAGFGFIWAINRKKE